MGNYYCPDCGNTFDEPRRYVEMHGFTYGPGEHWAVCPYCGESGWGDTVYCAECGEPHLAEELTEDLCEECYVDECAYCTDPICYYGGCSYLKGGEDPSR